jgi:hypothetical protein
MQPDSARDGDASRSFALEGARSTGVADRRDPAVLPSSSGSGGPPLARFPAAPPPNTPASSTDSADHMSDRAEIPSRNAGTSAAATTALNGSRRRRGLRAPTVQSKITLRVDRPSCGRLTSAARSLLLRAAFSGRCRRRLYDNVALRAKPSAALQGRGGAPPRAPPKTISSAKTPRTNPALPRARHDRKPALSDDRVHLNGAGLHSEAAPGDPRRE